MNFFSYCIISSRIESYITEQALEDLRNIWRGHDPNAACGARHVSGCPRYVTVVA
jgi:hypothetical protein